MDSQRSRKCDLRVPPSGRLSFAGNAHPQLEGKPGSACYGLDVLEDPGHVAALRALLGGGSLPDAVVLHSGIADLCRRYQLDEAAMRRSAERAARWWAAELSRSPGTRVVLLSTVATSGIGVCARFHMARVRWWNAVRLAAFREGLRARGVPFTEVDAYGLTEPFHWDNDYGDGTSYGVTNPQGRRDAQARDFVKLSRFLANKRYDPSVGLAVAAAVAHASCAPRSRAPSAFAFP
eukprot:TRINITY_DN16464_c0_g1_i1.p2 TRINITY_DN16464_c0_g1~~TRINITY_DN16464_c0_g1_i1.p2  ORF type:complete len:235 (+),score=46.72 TRINITY_DN16464_c0_g1_i1:1106-1810(+)